MTADAAGPTVSALLTTWTWTPTADVLLMLAIVGYLVLALRHRRRRQSWPTTRIVCWMASATFLVLALNSAMAVYAHHLFWVHMIVHLVLITVVPTLAVWAQPIRLLHDAGGPRVSTAVDHARNSWIFRALISPRLTVPLYTAVLVLTHLTGFQQAMSEHAWIHDSELALYLVTGYLLLLPLAGDELTSDAPLAPFLRFVILAICMGPDTLVGVVLMMTRVPLAPGYAASRDWGPTALVDQSAAGAIMWFGGDGLMMILMVVIGGHWIASGDRTGSSVGPWLDRIRRQTILGADADSLTDIENDEAALNAYNARLAALHGRPVQTPTNRTHDP